MILCYTICRKKRKGRAFI